jgi:hypothetical protein
MVTLSKFFGMVEHWLPFEIFSILVDRGARAPWLGREASYATLADNIQRSQRAISFESLACQ